MLQCSSKVQHSFKMQKAGRIAAALAVFIISTFTLPQEMHAAAFYTTEEYHVTIDVKENNTLAVTEEIKIDAFNSGHGIYRYIPLKGTAYLEIDGKTEEIERRMKISDVKVAGYDYETDVENGNLVIKIGSPDYFINGPQVYQITYTCTLYEDAIESKDFFYYNVIPQGWETSIADASVTIRFPKDFDSEKVWVYTGSYGSFSDGQVIPEFVQNTIVLECGALDAGEGVTLQADLPEGYFVGAANTDFAVPLLYGIILLTVAAALLLWFFFGRDPDMVQTVEFYPPPDITPADAGYLLDGMANKEDMVSMILYFADKGYLTIEEQQKKNSGFSAIFDAETSVFYLNKQKELPPEEKVFAATLFYGLFENGDRVELSELSGSFYAHYSAAREQLSAYYNQTKEKRVYTLSSGFARLMGYFLIALPIFAAVTLSGIASYDFESVILGIPPTIGAVIGYLIVVIAYDKRYVYSAGKVRLLHLIGFLLAGAASFFALFICTQAYGRPEAGVFGVAGSFAAAMFVRVMHKRTESSARLLGQLIGFKDFIRLAEQDRIEKLAADNPAYFYDDLPYAYVFGLSGEWAKKFEGIALSPPSWYYGSGFGMENQVFNTWIFMNAFQSCAGAMTETLTIPPADQGGSGFGSSGGFGSGGGFSGGGFGGGGGGGW